MFKEKENKWTRERRWLEVHAGDIMMVGAALFFLGLTVFGVGFLILQPTVPGLKALFSDPPPTPHIDQPLHLTPGETEIKLYPGKPAPKPAEPKK